MTNNIVTVNVSQTLAPAPSTLQQIGAFISQGATTLTSGTKSLLTQFSDLTAILSASKPITSMTWSTNVVTATTTSPHGYTNGETVQLLIAGVTPAGYNGVFACTITGASTFTYPLLTNPGSSTVQGTVVVEDEQELVAMATTFFAQGNATGVYVLELGEGTPADGVTSLNTYIQANLLTIYSFLVPRAWAAEPTFITMAANYTAPTARTYFFVTMTSGNYTGWTALDKCVVGMVEATGIAVTEFSLAALFYVTLNYNPSSGNLVTPTAFSYLYGVTAINPIGNGPLLAALKTANVNVVATGAEGGISLTMVKWGVTMDGNDFTYWYSVDWVQINMDLNIANEIINGSNNPTNPLYYNQAGITRLQARAQAVMTQAISYGLALSPATVTAIPFAAYVAANPSNYPKGIYTGLAVTYTPARGFISITFNVNVTQFVTQ